MSTTADDLRRKLGLPALEKEEEEPVSSAANIAQRLGLTPVGLLQEEVNHSPVASFGAGLARGILDPITFIPKVHEAVEKLKTYDDGDVGSKIGYGLGFIGGFAVPGGLAYKASTGVMKGLGVIKAADHINDLSRGIRFARGALAGAMMSVGRESENAEDWIKNVALESTLFGVGDVVIPAALSAVSARIGKKVNKDVQEAVEAAVKQSETVQTKGLHPRAIEAHAKAMAYLDDFNADVSTDQAQYYKALAARGEELPPQFVPTAARRAKAKLGLEQLGLDQLRPGEMRMIPRLVGEPEDMKALLKASGLEFRQLTHKKPKPIVFTEKTADSVVKVYDEKLRRGTVTDYLIGFADDFDDELAKSFEKHGFVPGQAVLHKGTKYTILGSSTPGKVRAVREGLGRQHAVSLDWGQVRPLPIVTKTKFSGDLKNLSGLWAEFLNRGAKPPRIPGEEKIPPGFTEDFAAFAGEKGWDRGTALRVKNYFIEQQRALLKEIDPETHRAITKLNQNTKSLLGKEHPEGVLEELAAERGLTFYQRMNDKGNWEFVFKDLITGAETSPPGLIGKQKAQLWVSQLARTSGDNISAISPLADELVESVGAGVVPPRGGLGMGNYSPPFLLELFAPIMPRVQFVREMNDRLITELGDEAPDLFRGGMQELMDALGGYRNELFEWGAQLKKIRGKGLKTNVRKEVGEGVVDLLEAPADRRAQVIKEWGLNEKEVKAAGELRDLFDRFWTRISRDENIDLSFEDFIENYFPHYRRATEDGAESSVRAALAKKKLMPNEKVIKWMSEYQRKGVLDEYQKDPFMITMSYLRSGLFKAHVSEPYKRTYKFIDGLPQTGEMASVTRSLQEYMRLTSYGAPEHFYAVRKAVESISKSMDFPLEERTADQLVNTLVTLNYGAYMGFRPGLALRNLTQLLVATYPMLGGKWMGKGLKLAFQGSKDELYKEGIVLRGSISVPYEDVVLAETMGAIGKSEMRRSLVKGTVHLTQAGKTLAQVGIGGGEGKVTKHLGLFQAADEFNRAVSYFGQKGKALDALNKWKRGEIELDAMLEKSGATSFGPTVLKEFRKIAVDAKRTEDAAKYLGKMMSNDTQWLYQLGAGPSLFSQGVGRLFGQYGTWASWYGTHLYRGMKWGTANDKKRFAARTMLLNGAFIYAGAETALNINRWTGLASLRWMGGPFVDWGVDLRDVITGIRTSGEATANRQLALSKYNLKDDPDGVGLRDPTRIDIDVDPGETFAVEALKAPLSFMANFMPGYMASRDLARASKQSDPVTFLQELLNLPLDDGSATSTWPQIQAR